MSWDIVLFNSRQRINSLEEIKEEKLELTDFCFELENQFDKIERNDNHIRIIGNEFEIEYFVDTENVSNKILNIYGEKGFFEIVMLARQKSWQVFDTGLGKMLNLDNPEVNGYENFNKYLKKVLNIKQ